MKQIFAAKADINKKSFFILRLLLALPILMLAVFCWGEISAADDNLKISQVQFDGGTGKTNEDFIEIENISVNEINLKGYRLAKVTSSEKRYNIKSWTSDTFLESGKKYVWANSTNGFAESIQADASTTETISKDNNILLIQGSLEDGLIIDSFIYKEESDTDNENNSGTEEISENTNKASSYADKIIINELYPAPPSAKVAAEAGITDVCLQNEFVEIKNTSGDEIDFSTWTIKDEKGTKGKFLDRIKSGIFYIFCGSFSLNNDTKGDTVFLYDEKDLLVASRKYQSGKSQHAYAFDGSAWRWTSKPSPGKENTFDKKLSGKILKDKEIYKNTYAEFEVKADRDAQKFTWDFGDGHKSYLQKTRHKYEKTGTYPASLKIRGDGEDAFYEFAVKVKKYVAPKIRITKVSPNPAGSDTKNEWLEIKNSSKKKINLKGWSIATGWDNLYNHPIREDFIIKTGKTKKLMRDICAFTLANTKTKIELRDPSGKTVQKIIYNNGKKSITEDALYQKETGSGWEWSESTATVGADLVSASTAAPTHDAPKVVTGRDLSLQIDPALIGKYCLNSAWQEKQAHRIQLANSTPHINMPSLINNNRPLVLGARAIPVQENYYFFTKNISQKHWAVQFVENFWEKINSRFNRILNTV